MGTDTSGSFPRFVQELRQVVDAHQRLEDEPLILAVYFAPDRDPQDVFLLEVADGFGEDSVDPEKNLFEYYFSGGYAQSLGLPWENGRRLHVVLTNPTEFEVALRESWPSAAEVREAVRTKRAQVLLKEGPKGEKLWGLLLNA